MDVAMTNVAERLAGEFADLPITLVIRVVTDSADEFEHADALLVEQAARARLRAVRSSREAAEMVRLS